MSTSSATSGLSVSERMKALREAHQKGVVQAHCPQSLQVRATKVASKAIQDPASLIAQAPKATPFRHHATAEGIRAGFMTDIQTITKGVATLDPNDEHFATIVNTAYHQVTTLVAEMAKGGPVDAGTTNTLTVLRLLAKKAYATSAYETEKVFPKTGSPAVEALAAKHTEAKQAMLALLSFPGLKDMTSIDIEAFVGVQIHSRLSLIPKYLTFNSGNQQDKIIRILDKVNARTI